MHTLSFYLRWAKSRFPIGEFFSRKYSENLHLYERLVIQYTGHTFREELTARRISAANHLLHTTAMPLTEVARYVGYHSYAGF